MEKFEAIPLDEQETIIHIDYYSCEVTLFTTREAVYRRMSKRLGTPDEIRKNKEGKIESVKFRRSFSDKKDLAKVFTKTGVVGSVKKKKDVDSIDDAI